MKSGSIALCDIDDEFFTDLFDLLQIHFFDFALYALQCF